MEALLRPIPITSESPPAMEALRNKIRELKKEAATQRQMEEQEGEEWVDHFRFIATAVEHSMMVDTRIAAVQFSPSNERLPAAMPTPRPSLCINRFRC
jgi:hypothetical protein